MKYIKTLSILILSLFIGVYNVNAEENPKTVFDENVLVNYDIIGSSVIGGYNVTITNKIDGAALILGNSINVNSNIEYALITGQDITVNGKIKDALIFGNSIVLNESSNIERDIIIYGNNIEISGLINRDVTIYGSNVKIDSVQIAGDIKITADNIDITENSVIMGKLSYNDDAILEKAETSSIGEIEVFERVIDRDPTFIEMVIEHLIKLVSLLVIFVVMMLIIPKLFNNIGNSKNEIVRNMGYGIISLIVIPIIALILMLTKFGLPLGLILLVLYLISIYISTIVTGYLLGNIIWNKFIKIKKTIYLEGLLGITILYIISLIPYVGTAIYFISLIISMGTILNILFKKRKK